jgi:transposase InsO family protein
VERVIAMKRTHQDWGKQRIADELQKANRWVPLVSASTVGRILRQHGLLSSLTRPAKQTGPACSSSARHAEQPGQTVNADLCFVPVRHEISQELPAVSGSSGVLKISPTTSEAGERTWPGQVFEQFNRSYEEVMAEGPQGRKRGG